MSSTHTTLDAAATERKARLAKLASLKRKQPGSDTTVASTTPQEQEHSEEAAEPSKTDIYLSGRNYDTQTKGPKLGFEAVPQADQDTVEARAEKLSLSVAEQAARDEAEAEKGIDLFKLQPKKPNWDLKRDLAERTRVLDVRTQNAIARLVRERIENTKKEAQGRKAKDTDKLDDRGEEMGLEGSTLVEGVHQREREEEEEERREQELEQEEAA